MREHCLEKNELEFLFEICYEGRMRGIFLLFKSIFIKDQYALAFFRVSFNLFIILL